MVPVYYGGKMITINRESHLTLYEQLYLQLKDDILNNIIGSNSRLPATRKLADELGISRNTVVSAYHQLEIEGYLRSVAGSGFYVNPLVKVNLMHSSNNNVLKVHSTITDKDIKESKYDFQYGSIDSDIFPANFWRKSIAAAFDTILNQESLPYMDKQGELRLRVSIANYLYQARGVRCSPEQIVITSGHQHSLEILTKLFPKINYSVSLEEPGYDGTRIIFDMNQYEINTIALENDGIRLKKLSKLHNTLLYITPSHQFPTGCVLSISKRLSILDWASKNESYIIEDDYDSELRYHMLPIPSLQSLDSNGRTIYLGTFSKCLSPDLRISYIVLPDLILKKYQEIYKHINCTVPKILQIALYEFFESGNFGKHINILRTHYKKKHEILCNSIKKTFGQKAIIHGSSAGLHLLLSIQSDYNQNEIIERAANHSVQVYPTDVYWIDKKNCPHNQIMLGFSKIKIHDIPLAIQELYHAIYG